MSKYGFPTPPMNRDHSNEPYVHYTWKEFQKRGSYSHIGTKGDLTAIYNSQASAARSRFSSAIGGGVSETEAQEIMSRVASLYEGWTSNAAEKAVELSLKSDIENIIKKIDAKNLYKTLHHSRVKDVASNATKLNEAFLAQQEIMKDIEAVDKKILDYYRQKVGKSFKSFGAAAQVKDGIQTLAQTPRVHTAVKNWKRGWKVVKKNMDSTHGSSKVKYKQVSRGGDSTVEREVSDIIKDTVGHLNAVKGEILEVGFAAMLRGNLDEVAKSLRDAGAVSKIKAQALGDQKIYDPKLKDLVTRKTDVGITVVFADKNNLTVDFGFSAKAQFKNGPKKVTAFLGSSYERIMDRADLLGGYAEYCLNNLMAHKQYKSTLPLRKWVAAQLALTAVGGIEKLDEVYFIVYLDKIVTLPDLLEEIGRTPGAMLKMEIEGASSITPAQKMTTKWVRSHETTQTIRSLAASIRGRT